MGFSGYEIVATQMSPSYPFVSDDFLGRIRSMNDRYGIELSCYAANMDCGLMHGRSLTEDEMLQRAIIDIKSAAKLGCTVMREQYLCGPSVMSKLAPIAEQYGVRVGIEIHNPEYPMSPIMQEYLNVFERLQNPYIGFIPDFGCFAVKPNKPHWDEALRKGATEEMLKRAESLRASDVPLTEARRIMIESGANEAAMGAFHGMYGFVTFYQEPDLAGLEHILPYCIEMHGKFHYIHEDLHEHSIPYDRILPIIQRSHFDGYIMSEYEDHSAGDTMTMMHRHIAMEKQLLNM